MGFRGRLSDVDVVCVCRFSTGSSGQTITGPDIKSSRRSLETRESLVCANQQANTGVLPQRVRLTPRRRQDLCSSTPCTISTRVSSFLLSCPDLHDQFPYAEPASSYVRRPDLWSSLVHFPALTVTLPESPYQATNTFPPSRLYPSIIDIVLSLAAPGMKPAVAI